MKKIALFLAAVMTVALIAGCSSTSDSGKGSSAKEINLDGYVLADPEGVEYEERTALYMPHIEGDEMYELGAVTCYMVYYYTGSDGKCMVTLETFDTEEHATAYLETAGNGEVDGTVYINTVDESFFVQMSSFIPTVQDWINNAMASGFMEVEK